MLQWLDAGVRDGHYTQSEAFIVRVIVRLMRSDATGEHLLPVWFRIDSRPHDVYGCPIPYADRAPTPLQLATGLGVSQLSRLLTKHCEGPRPLLARRKGVVIPGGWRLRCWTFAPVTCDPQLFARYRDLARARARRKLASKTPANSPNDGQLYGDKKAAQPPANSHNGGHIYGGRQGSKTASNSPANPHNGGQIYGPQNDGPQSAKNDGHIKPLDLILKTKSRSGVDQSVCPSPAEPTKTGTPESGTERQTRPAELETDPLGSPQNDDRSTRRAALPPIPERFTIAEQDLTPGQRRQLAYAAWFDARQRVDPTRVGS